MFVSMIAKSSLIFFYGMLLCIISTKSNVTKAFFHTKKIM